MIGKDVVFELFDVAQRKGGVGEGAVCSVKLTANLSRICCLLDCSVRETGDSKSELHLLRR